MIQAAILAGGLGTRMRPLTENVPKPMLPVLGRPFLEHQIELLQSNGIDRVVLLIGYLGEGIKSHFGGRVSKTIEVSFSYEPSPLGTGGALKNAAVLLEQEFLVVNGDTFLDIDYVALVKRFRSEGSMAMVTAYRNDTGWVASNLAIDSRGIVLDYAKQHPTGEYVDAGVLVARKTILGLIPDGQRCSLEQEVFPKLIKSSQLKAWPIVRPFFDMGTPSGLTKLEQHLRDRRSS